MNEQEITHLRSYLSHQAVHRSPEQLVEALQETYHEFVQALEAIPAPLYRVRPGESLWSAADILEHVQTVCASYEKAICTVLAYGERPEEQSQAISGAIAPKVRNASRADVQEALEAEIRRLTQAVLRADPHTALDVTWGHFELGQMHWPEWVLFVRVHLIDHVRQMHALAHILTP